MPQVYLFYRQVVIAASSIRRVCLSICACIYISCQSNNPSIIAEERKKTKEEEERVIAQTLFFLLFNIPLKPVFDCYYYY